ncbi:MAG: C4-dicarboxylate transporter DctA [Sandaracinus sp.]
MNGSDPPASAAPATPPSPEPSAKGAHRALYLQVLAGIALGALLGAVEPTWGEALRPLGELFVRMVKMLIAPIVFATVVHGIAGVGDLRRVGRVGLKALVYFEGMTTIALVIGLVVVHVLQPGAGLHRDAAELGTAAVEAQTHGRESMGIVEHLTNIVPESAIGAFTGGEILQVLFVSVLVGLAIASMGEKGKPALHAVDALAQVLFRVIALVMRLAPIGAFGAMAYTVGHFGVASLGSLLALMLGFYATALVFVFVGLGTVCALVGVSLVRLLVYLREELLVVLGTSSSESVLPRLMDKLEALGCGSGVVRLVVPTGYSFNLDGTSIYLTMAAIFVAQATDTELTWHQEAILLAVLLLTSKGAAAVTGGGFVTLAATLQATGAIPVSGLSLLVGVDRFMSEARAITNMIGNAVATLVVARWEGELDLEKARRTLAGASGSPPPR